MGFWCNHQNGEISSRQIPGQNGLQGICYCFMVISTTNLGIWRIWTRALGTWRFHGQDLKLDNSVGVKGSENQLTLGFWSGKPLDGIFAADSSPALHFQHQLISQLENQR